MQPCVCESPCDDVDCEESWRDRNSHARGPAYYEESILSDQNFLAWRCAGGWEEFKDSRACNYSVGSAVVSLGEWTGQGEVEGVFYLTTGGVSPYSCHGEQCFTPEP